MNERGRLSLVIALAILAGADADARRPRPRKAAPVVKGLQPLGNYRNWFSTKDYPQDAAIARQQGTTGFQLDVDPSGLPADCHILQSSGSKSLDDRTCTIMMSRARFRQVFDKKHQPIPGTFKHAMIWKLPVRKEERVVDRSFDARSIIDPSGNVVSCTLSGGGASKIASNGGSCGPFGSKDFFLGYMGDDYKKIRSTNVRMSIFFNSNAPVDDKTASFQKTLAKASIDISPAGDMTNCTSLLKMEALGKTLNLCDLIRADPPRFPSAPAARKGTISLDLIGYSR